MPKVALNIFKVGEEYRAVIQKGENPVPVTMGVLVYQEGKEIDSFKDVNEAIRELKDKAIKWAREQGIEFVHNIDINPYD